MKKKMTLDGLKVKSFVTGLEYEVSQTAKAGGITTTTTITTTTIPYTLVTYFKEGCDIYSIGHDDGTICISKDPEAWCGGR